MQPGHACEKRTEIYVALKDNGYCYPLKFLFSYSLSNKFYITESWFLFLMQNFNIIFFLYI
jgi:hypothetical protein